MDMDKQKAKCASSMRSNLFVKEIFLQSTIKTVTELCVSRVCQLILLDITT